VPLLDAPTLRDGDLILRPRRIEDADAVVAACQDPEIPRWTGVPSPYGLAEYLAWLSGDADPDAARAVVHVFAVDGDDTLLGSFSLMEIDEERSYGEIGYWVAATARNRGIATRAVVLLTDWAHAEVGLSTIEIIAHEDNLASQRVAERAGYERLEGRRAAPRIGTDEPVFVAYASRT
jgi:RimJ/RimL family protein N-acetyltransferase